MGPEILIGSLLLPAVAGVASTLLTPKAAAAPAAPKQVAMPVADDEAMRRSRKRDIAMQANRSGRASTILTAGDSDTLGG